MNSIPASDIVKIIPSVVGAGGNALDLSGVFLTTNARVPIGAALSFPSQLAVSQFFGAASPEAAAAGIYFGGFNGATAVAGALWVAQYNQSNVGAWLRGGNISTLTLTQLQAISGVLSVTIDGTLQISGSFNLSGATSFTQAAQTINGALGLTGPTQASVVGSIGAVFTASGSGTSLTVSAITSGVIHPGDAITGIGVPGSTTIVSQTSGTTGGTGVYVTNNATTSSGATITATSTTVDVTAVSSGTLAIGQEISGAGVTTNTYITALGTGTGGAGTYIISIAQEVVSETLTATMPVVTYDTVAGAFYVISSTTGAGSTISFASGSAAAALMLTQPTGATNSQGAAAATPGPFMTALTAITQNWFSFSTMFDPDNGSGNAQKLLFAAWVNSTGNRFLYVAWDTDITPTETMAASSSFGYLCSVVNDYSGVEPIYSPAQGVTLAAFEMGCYAALNFAETNGRATMAFRSQTGIAADVNSQAVASNLRANGYNFYGVWATANQSFTFFDPGSVTGPFLWADSYADQVWMNNQFQLQLLALLVAVKSVPYNPAGYALLKATILTVVLQALNFGAIRTNVALSATQAAEVNTQAGVPIDQVLSTQGYYIQVLDPPASVRVARGTPRFTFWWVDGESVQSLTMGSVEVQ